MNIINKLTLRQLKKNKRRTTVTVLGVVISVTMIMAVMTIGISFLDMFKRAVVMQSGSWEAEYYNVATSDIKTIEDHKKVKDVALVDKQGVASITDLGLSDKLNKSYVEVFALNEQAQQMYSVQLLEGRLAQNNDEIVIPESYTIEQNKEKLKLGDVVTLQLGERVAYNADGQVLQDYKLTHNVDKLDNQYRDGTHEKLENVSGHQFTIVGVVKDSVWDVAWGGSQIALTSLNEQALTGDATIDIVGTTYSENSRAIFDIMEGIANDINVEYRIHHDLLRYNLLSSVDSLQITIYGLTGIIMFIVIVGSISLIYNAFGISVADRSKYLGMLASVGATKRQKRNSVLFEAGIISLVSIPLGLLAGYVGLLLTFNVINRILKNLDMINVDLGLEVLITPATILLATLVSLLTIFISAWLPARRASKITAIEAIRMSHDVKITKRQVKNNRLVRMIFGLEADIALKNLKRNKRRYQVTVFSLVISIVLFISASYFTHMMQKGNELATSDINFQVSASVYYDKAVNFDRHELINNSEIYDYAFVSAQNVEVDVAYEHINEGLKQHIEAGKMAANDNGTVTYKALVYALDDESFNEYVKEQHLEQMEWQNEDQLNAILVNHTVYSSQLSDKKVEDILLKDANNMSISPYKESENAAGQSEKLELPEITIASVVSEPPIWLESSGSISTLILVMPESQLSIFSKPILDNWVDFDVYIQSENPSKVAQYLLGLQPENVKMQVWNIEEYGDKVNGIIVILNIFTYGFIALITFISLANIMNTISTGIQLRKREFAMLRSMGMTEKGFYRMINYESIFYGIKSLLYGIPISLAFIYFMYWSMSQSMGFKFEIPWLSYIIAIVGIFIIVTIVMYYAGSKVKKGSIVEAIKQENS